MKKTIAILLVAILAVSSVFAAFSGEAKLGFGVNLDNGNFGFIDKAANVKFDLDLATANAESVGEGEIYASIKATFGLKLTTGEKKYGEGDPYGGLAGNTAVGGVEFNPSQYPTISYIPIAGPYGNNFALGIIADITEAKVGGENWYISLLGIADAPNYASSAIDTYTVEDGYDKWGMPREDFDKAYNYGVGFEKAPGVEVSVYDYKVGFGLLGDYDESGKDDNWKFKDNFKLSVYAETPEYDFGGLTAQLGAVYSYSAFDKIDSGKVVPYDPNAIKNAIGVSAKVGFANDTLSASVATDMGFNLEGDKFDEVFDMDVAANFNWSFLTLDTYYATNAKSGETATPVWGDFDKTSSSYTENVLSAQVKFDLNAFEVPVAITASAKDLLHKVDLGVKAEVTPVEGLKLTANAGYVVDTIDAYNKADWIRSTLEEDGTDKELNDAFKEEFKGVFLGQWKFGLDAEYDFGFAKVAAGVSLKNLGLKATIDAEKDRTFDPDFEKRVQDKAMDGDFKEPADRNNYVVNQVVLGMSASVSTTSIIPGAELKLAWENADDLLSLYQYDADHNNLGKITASCKITF